MAFKTGIIEDYREIYNFTEYNAYFIKAVIFTVLLSYLIVGGIPTIMRYSSLLYKEYKC